MPYVITAATPEERALVVEAMRAAAGTRHRAAAKAAAGTMEDKRAGKDVRARSVRLVAMLAEAADLERLAAELEGAPELALLTSTAERVDVIRIPEPAPGVYSPEQGQPAPDLEDVTAPELDAAHRLAEVDRLADAAGLKPALLADGTVAEDELGVAEEDVPTDDEVVEVLTTAGASA